MIRKFVSEFIGTFVLVSFGCGSAIAVDSSNKAAWLLTVALAFGLVIIAMAYSIGNISGCHINPAVSVAMLIRKKLNWNEFVIYIISQCTGAIAGAAMLLLLFGKDCGFGANICNQGFTIGQCFVSEVLLTFVFVITVIGATSTINNNISSGIIIGLTLTLVHIMGISITGTSVNPARSLAPALFAGGDALSQLWIFIVAPFLGGIAAAFVYSLLEKEE